METPIYTLAEFVSEALPPDGYEQWYAHENQAHPFDFPITRPWSGWWGSLNVWMAERGLERPAPRQPRHPRTSKGEDVSFDPGKETSMAMAIIGFGG